jgi:hypothetical protein
MDKTESSPTTRYINVCDDGKCASPGDPIQWYNPFGFPVHIHFDTPDGCPLDECDHPFSPNETHTNHVNVDATLGSYHYRVVPPCTHAGNPRIIIK